MKCMVAFKEGWQNTSLLITLEGKEELVHIASHKAHRTCPKHTWATLSNERRGSRALEARVEMEIGNISSSPFFLAVPAL